MNTIAVPKGWRLLRNGTRERPTDRFRFRTEGGAGRLGSWTPLYECAVMPRKVRQQYLTIRKGA